MTGSEPFSQQIAILSNGTPAMLEAAVKSSGLKKLMGIKSLADLPALLGF